MAMTHTLDDQRQRTVADLRNGQSSVVVGLGRSRGFRSRLLGMGIRPGTEIKVTEGYGDGPRILEIGRQKIMVGRQMLSHIYIEEQ